MLAIRMSQNTLIFQKSNPLQALTGLARTISLPHEFAPVRYPSFPALERTAVIGFNAPYQWDPPSTNSHNKAILTRQAAYPFWVEKTLASTKPLAHGYYTNTDETFLAPVAAGNTGPCIVTPLPRIARGYSKQTGVANALEPAFTCGEARPDYPLDYPIIGVDEACGMLPFLYVPAGGTVVAIGTTEELTAMSDKFVINLEAWACPGQTRQLTSILHTGGWAAKGVYGTLVLGEATWVRFRSIVMQGSDAASTAPAVRRMYLYATNGGVSAPGHSTVEQVSYSFGSAGINAVLPVSGVPEFSTSSIPWRSTRTTAASVLFTNVTPVLNKAGTFLGARVNPNSHNPFTISPEGISAFHPAEKAFLNAETGFYTYCPPSTDLAHFWDYCTQIGGGVGEPPESEIPNYRLDNDSLVNVIFFKDNVFANFAINLDWHLEFRNTSALFQIGLAAATLESLHQAQLTLTEVGFFFANETHKVTIGQILRKLASAAMKYVPFGDKVMSVMNKRITVGKQTVRPTAAVPTRGQMQRNKKQQGKKGKRQPPQQQKPKKAGGLQMYLDAQKRK